MKPKNIKYTLSHLWVSIDSAVAKIGITDYANKELGDLVFIELPQKGAKLQKGDKFGSIESVKSVSDLETPITGEVLGVNEMIINQPDIVNKDPYGQGWLIQQKIEKPHEIDELIDESMYIKNLND